MSISGIGEIKTKTPEWVNERSMRIREGNKTQKYIEVWYINREGERHTFLEHVINDFI